MMMVGNALRMRPVRQRPQEPAPTSTAVYLNWEAQQRGFREMSIRVSTPDDDWITARVIPDEAPEGETWDEWLDRSQKKTAQNREWNR